MLSNQKRGTKKPGLTGFIAHQEVVVSFLPKNNMSSIHYSHLPARQHEFFSRSFLAVRSTIVCGQNVPALQKSVNPEMGPYSALTPGPNQDLAFTSERAPSTFVYSSGYDKERAVL